MEPTIREAEVADAEAIAGVHVSSWREGYRGQVAEERLEQLDEEKRRDVWHELLGEDRERGEVAVAELEGEVVGFVHCGPYRDGDLEDFDPGEIYALYVDPEYWRRGIGRELLRRAVDVLGDASYDFAALWVLESNSRARAFYETAGFVPDQTWKTEEILGVELEITRYRGVLG